MRLRFAVPAIFALAACLLTGCEHMPGYPGTAPAPPQDEMNFKVLYSQNCAGCHGAKGAGGAAVALANPEYLAIADDATLTKWISNGMPGSQMPAFAKSAGGLLTDQQVSVLVKGMRESWGQPNALAGQNPPAYAQPANGGDAHRGEQAYNQNCAGCHTGNQASITNASFLALVSDQSLRTTIIAGRPDLGQPDWRNDKAGHPLTDQDVTDIVSYLGSLRSPTPGQPYPSHQ